MVNYSLRVNVKEHPTDKISHYPKLQVYHIGITFFWMCLITSIKLDIYCFLSQNFSKSVFIRVCEMEDLLLFCILFSDAPETDFK